MQIRNAAYDRQLDLLDCRLAMFDIDLYAIESDETFEELKRRCFNCSFQEACAVDLRRDPSSVVWESYCPNAATICELAVADALIDQPAHVRGATRLSVATDDPFLNRLLSDAS